MMMTKRFVSLILLTITTLLSSLSFTSARPIPDDEDCIIDTVSLGKDPRSTDQNFETQVDIYICTTSDSDSDSDSDDDDDGTLRPLIVLSPAQGVLKSAYATFAKGVSDRGYVVAVIEHLFSFSPFAPAFNTVNSVDVQNTIEYTINAYTDIVDDTSIALLGHSYGGGVVLYNLNEECPFPFCQDPNVPFPQGVTVPLHPGVKFGLAYGFSLNDRRTNTFFTLTNTNQIPFGIINGAGDINYFTDIQGENLTTGTFQRLHPTKVIATIENLDHFSISAINTNPNRGDVLSTKPREEQLKNVIDAVSLYLDKSFDDDEDDDGGDNNPSTKFCEKIEDRGQKEGYAIVDCLEDYYITPSTSSSNDEDE